MSRIGELGDTAVSPLRGFVQFLVHGSDLGLYQMFAPFSRLNIYASRRGLRVSIALMARPDEQCRPGLLPRVLESLFKDPNTKCPSSLFTSLFLTDTGSDFFRGRVVVSRPRTSVVTKLELFMYKSSVTMAL